MIIGALCIGILAGIVGFGVTLAAGGGLFWGICAYIGLGITTTLAVLTLKLSRGSDPTSTEGQARDTQP